VNLRGGWVGEYGHDSTSHALVPFRMELSHSWLVRLSGVVRDGEGGVPEEAALSGWLLGSKVRFQKRQLGFWVLDEGRTMPLRELASAKYGATVADVSQPPIMYVGTLTADGQSMSGSWRIRPNLVPFIGEDRGFSFPEITGTWNAKRRGSE